MRFDKLASLKYPQISRTQILHLIRDGKVELNNTFVTNPSKMTRSSDIVYIQENTLDAVLQQNESIKNSFKTIEPANMDIPIIFENDDFLVIDKPVGVSVHTSKNERANTVLNWLVYKYGLNDVSFPKSVTTRPYIVHRIDKDTSGLLLIAKNYESQRELMELFAKREVYKEYLAIGIPSSLSIERKFVDINGDKNEFKVEGYVAHNPREYRKMMFSTNKLRVSKYSLSYISPIEIKNNMILFKIAPKTGRTHQIRLHLKYLGTPILGDKLYSGTKNEKRMYLLAKSLTFIYRGKEYSFSLDIPNEFIQRLKQ